MQEANVPARQRKPLRAAAYPTVIGLAVGALVTGVLLPMTIEPRRLDAAVRGAEASGSFPTGAGPGTGPETTLVPGGQAAGKKGPAASTTGAVGPGAGSGGAPRATSGAPAGAASAAGRGSVASEVGVTAKDITLGVLLFDLGGVGRMGFGAPGANAPEQRSYYDALIADVNEKGGVHGRMLAPEYVVFDPLQRDDAVRACVEVTEDVKPFMVLSTGGFTGDAALCITERHATPLIAGQGEADEFYARSAGRLFTPEMSATRMARVMARRSHDQERLQGRKIGVIHAESSESKLPTEGGLLPQLRALGYDVAHVSRLSDDLSTAQSQIPIEVAEMRRKGVDRVFATTNPALTAFWINQAESQGHRPLYILSDVASASNDFTVQSAPRSLQAIAYTVMRLGEARRPGPEQPEAADCRARYQRRAGKNVERDSSGYQQLTAICGTISTFTRAAVNAGPDLTRPSWTIGLHRLGAHAFPDIGGTISFGPRAFDGADYVRTKQFDGGCRCFEPVDDFTPAT